MTGTDRNIVDKHCCAISIEPDFDTLVSPPPLPLKKNTHPRTCLSKITQIN